MVQAGHLLLSGPPPAACCPSRSSLCSFKAGWDASARPSAGQSFTHLSKPQGVVSHLSTLPSLCLPTPHITQPESPLPLQQDPCVRSPVFQGRSEARRGGSWPVLLICLCDVFPSWDCKAASKLGHLCRAAPVGEHPALGAGRTRLGMDGAWQGTENTPRLLSLLLVLLLREPCRCPGAVRGHPRGCLLAGAGRSEGPGGLGPRLPCLWWVLSRGGGGKPPLHAP